MSIKQQYEIEELQAEVRTLKARVLQLQCRTDTLQDERDRILWMLTPHATVCGREAA